MFLLQVHLKDIITALVSRRKAYRLRDGHFQYAFGSDVTPRPYLKNSLPAYQSVTEWHVTFLFLFSLTLSLSD